MYGRISAKSGQQHLFRYTLNLIGFWLSIKNTYLQILMSVLIPPYVNTPVSTPMDHLTASVMKDIHQLMMEEHAWI
jgi:hypothetical protein